jgi:hypothetical protein
MTNSSESIAWSNCAALTQLLRSFRPDVGSPGMGVARAATEEPRRGHAARTRETPLLRGAAFKAIAERKAGAAAATKAILSRREECLCGLERLEREGSDGRHRTERARARRRVRRAPRRIEASSASNDFLKKRVARVETGRKLAILA